MKNSISTSQFRTVRLAATFALLVVSALMTVPSASAAGDWESLTAGDSLSAWKIYRKPADAPIVWTVEQGVVTWHKGAGSLLTKEKFSDFELELDWKLSPGGNSGVMFGVDENSSLPWHSGPEIQLLDDAKHKDGGNPLTSAGAIYSLYPPSKHAAKPVGEWNTLRLRVQAGHIQVWLNGQPVNDAQMNTPDWNARVAKSKFAPFKQFGHVNPGQILLQDHNEPVWFRNIRVKRL